MPGPDEAPESRVHLEYRQGKSNATQSVPMQWNPKVKQWETPENKRISLNEAIYYRFVRQKPGQPDEAVLDHTEAQNGFNVIPAQSPDPSSVGPALLVFRRSLVTPEQLQAHNQHRDVEGDHVVSKQTHFNRLGGSDASNGFLRQLFHQYGIKMVEDRPLIGGDNLSAHGYWTNSLYQLNSIIRHPSSFDTLALANLEDGARMCFDGAFVNEGMNGVHYLANLYYGQDSPFLNWFDYGKLDQFPHQPLKLGILPVKRDPKTGEEVVNHAAWNLRLIPPKNRDNPESPYFIELYDPRLENPDGTLRPASETKHLFLTNSQDSIQKYRFPIKQSRPQDIELLQEATEIKNPNERAKTLMRLLSEHNRFELTTRMEDNSGYCWDGQIDVKKVNIENPEVTQYVADACRYWTDKVDRLYTSHVGRAFSRMAGTDSKPNWLQIISDNTKKALGEEQGVLPALNRGETLSVSEASIQQALKAYRVKKQKQTRSAGAFMADKIHTQLPLGTLPASPWMQILLNTPRLKQLLNEGETPLWLEVATTLLKPAFKLLDWMLPSRKLGQRALTWLHNKFASQRSFKNQLAAKLDKSLTPALKQKLADPVLGHLVFEALGRSIFLSLLTGQFSSPTAPDKDLAPTKIAARMAQTLPPELAKAVPNQAARLLSRFLVRELQELELTQLNAPLTQLLKEITPEGAVVARHVLHERRLGLHWRIDAMKDLGDMDGVRAEPSTQLRYERLRDKELPKVVNIMSQVAQGIREAFPNSIIKAEITDLEALAGDKATELFKYLMGTRVINGIPNYNWMYSSGHKAVRMTANPDGDYPEQLTPADFLQHKLKAMLEVLPMDQALLFQNMTSNHDKSTSVFGLTVHPYEARLNYLGWIGMNFQDNGQDRGHFPLAVNELQSMRALQCLRQSLPDGVYDRLKSLAREKQEAILATAAQKAKAREDDFTEIGPYLLKQDQRPDPVTHRPVPLEVKRNYVDAMFDVLQPGDLGLNADQHQQLKNAVGALLTEPSEVKAFRGKFSNAFHALVSHPDALANALGKDEAKIQAVKPVLEALAPVFDSKVWEVTQHFAKTSGAWLGYQQLDYAVGWVLDAIRESLEETSPLKAALADPKAKVATTQAIYTQMVMPGLEQYKRIVALQMVTPGDPTLYLPDLLGQAGGEDLKNMYLGNRELIRRDWLNPQSPYHNPVIHRFFNELADLVRLRHENHVLNNGFVELPLDPARPEDQAKLNQAPIVPLVRDNGTDQALCLVNLGAPESPWNSWVAMREQREPNSPYSELHSTQPKVSNYSLDLTHLGVPEGALFESVDPEGRGTKYVVRNRRLVDADQPDKGIDVAIARVLKRVS